MSDVMLVMQFELNTVIFRFVAARYNGAGISLNNIMVPSCGGLHITQSVLLISLWANRVFVCLLFICFSKVDINWT